jgi:Protein of unknown function (DUF4199)
MSTKFTYALVLAIIGAIFSLLMYFTGFQTEKLVTGERLGMLMLVVHAAVLWFGLKAVREESPDKSLSYGQGVGAGVLISLYAGLMSAVYSFIHYMFINTSYVDYKMEEIRQKWVQAGMPDARMEQAEAFTRKFLMGPVPFAIIALFLSVVFGLILSLIIAAILKRPKPAGAIPPAAA